MTYNDYVKLGRALLREVRCYQVQIAYYATKVCTIRHGGKSGDLYTLSRYAYDIGMNSKTLSEWVSVYRNVILKLDKDMKKITPHDWTVAQRVNYILTMEKRAENEITGNPNKKSGSPYKGDFSKKKIKDLFKRNYDERSFQHEVMRCTDAVISVKNKLLLRDLSEASTSSLISLRENLDKASDIILNHLMNKRKVPLSDIVANTPKEQ